MSEHDESESAGKERAVHFVAGRIRDDVEAGANAGKVQTRFPPEPNGYLHIGHAQSVWLNFSMAAAFNGTCNLRFDDTNPSTEKVEYVDAIQDDIRWLGFDWGENLFFASDYFEKLYGFAVELIEKGKAYVCDLDGEKTREYRGTVTSPGRNSPTRDRTVAENLDLFARMRAGEFADGARTLRAKIDMASPNMNLRDPVMYRINSTSHHRTGKAWCIYPMYDWAHGQGDALEGVTHSICTLEFENHRPLYDWFLDNISAPCHPQQIEFARMNVSFTITSKRKLRELVEIGHVSGWDDPRMPTLRGLRRRGYTPESIHAFCEKAGITRFNGVTDVVLLENSLREDLNRRANRVMAVLRPLKVVIENYPEGEVEELDAVNNPEDPSAGTRKVPFAREIYIEREDFREEAPKKYFRLSPGREVRLRYAYYLTCTGFETDPESGEVTEVRCTYDPETRGGDSPDGRKVKGTLHWVSKAHAVSAEVRLYDRLFAVEDPTRVPEPGPGEEPQDFKANLNPSSVEVLTGCKIEPGLAGSAVGSRFQFERQGYFCVDPDSKPDAPVFNRAVGLRDSWAKIEKKGRGKGTP